MAAPAAPINLQEDWERACVRFLQTTQRDPRRQPVPSPEEVIRMVAATAGRNAKRNEKVDRVKDVLGKTLDCVLKFGAIVGTAASMAFPPSSMCVNAVSFFVDAGKSYMNIFSALETLFSRVFEALERGNHYMKNPDNLPLEMAQMAHEVLLKFISICELSHKVLQSNKFAQILRTLAFNSDAGVQAELASLERLEIRESRMGIAVTVTMSRAIQRDVARLTEQSDEMHGLGESIKQSREEATRQKQLEIIRANLGHPPETQSDDYLRVHNSLLPGSGDWTLDEPHIAAWKNAQSRDVSILFLAAEPGFGKTHVFTRILRDLQKQYKQGLETTDRVSIAYLYLDLDSRSSYLASEAKGGASASPRQNASVSFILRTWALQIARNDPFFCNEVCSDYSKRPGLSDDLLQLLNRFFPKKSPPKATFFLLVDAIDQLVDAEEAEGHDAVLVLTEALEHISSLSNTSLKVKVLLTGRLNVAERLSEKVPKAMNIVQIASKTGEDIKKYVTSRIESMEGLRSAQGSSFKDEVLAGLLKKLDGNFGYADYLLKRIAKEQRPSAIRNILDMADIGKRSSDSIGDDIRRCNRTLDPTGDIPDLNVLLLWVIHAFAPLTISHLRGALLIHGREVVLTFSNQIRDRFNLFFVVTPARDDGNATVELASDDIKEYFVAEARSQSNVVRASNDKVTEGEVRLLRNILQTLCDKKLYENFGFDKFFEEKFNTSHAVIAVPESDHAHVEIALRCLTACTGDYGNSGLDDDSIPLDELIYYGWNHLEDHLKQVEDLSLVDPSLKSKVGIQLYRFLTITDSEGLGPGRWGALMNTHIWYDDILYDEIVRFLGDGAVKKNLTVEERDWIKSRIGPEAEAGKTLFDSAAKAVALEWVNEPDTRFFFCLLGHINKTEHMVNSTVKRIPEVPDIDYIAIDTIYNVTAWALDQVDSKIAERNGKFALGKTLLMSGNYDEALRTFEAAKEAMDTPMLVEAEIAATWAAKLEWRKAIAILEPVIEWHRNGVQEDPEDENQRAALHESLSRLGQWYKKTGLLDEANRVYDEILERDLSNYADVADAIDLHLAQKSFDKVMSIAQRMECEQDDNEAEINRLQGLICSFESAQHLALFQAAKATEQLDFLRQQYHQLFDFYGDTKKGQRRKYDLIYSYARLKTFYALAAHQYYHTQEQRQQEEAHFLDVLDLKPRKTFERRPVIYLRELQSRCFHELLRVHGDNATSMGPESPERIQIATKVRQMANYIHDEDNEDLYGFSAAAARSALGRCFSKLDLLGDAREQLHMNIGVAIKLLSDDNPENDWQGYRRLGSALMNYGDLKNAVAAWTMIRPATEPDYAVDAFDEENAGSDSSQTSPNFSAKGASEAASDSNEIPPATETSATAALSRAPPNGEAGLQRADSSASSEAQSPPLQRSRLSTTAFRYGRMQGPLNYSCDGGCGLVWTYADDFHICRDCIDVQFCPFCHSRLLDGSLKHNECDKLHQFMYIPPLDPALTERLGSDHVMCDGEVLPVADWISRIRQEWSLDEDGNLMDKLIKTGA